MARSSPSWPIRAVIARALRGPERGPGGRPRPPARHARVVAATEAPSAVAIGERGARHRRWRHGSRSSHRPAPWQPRTPATPSVHRAAGPPPARSGPRPGSSRAAATALSRIGVCTRSRGNLGMPNTRSPGASRVTPYPTSHHDGGHIPARKRHEARSGLPSRSEAAPGSRLGRTPRGAEALGAPH
jgi:hypothetical protein